LFTIEDKIYSHNLTIWCAEKNTLLIHTLKHILWYNFYTDRQKDCKKHLSQIDFSALTCSSYLQPSLYTIHDTGNS